MGFESFFIKSEEKEQPPLKEEHHTSEAENNELDEHGKARRGLLMGSAALALSATLPSPKLVAAETMRMYSSEEKRENLLAIAADGKRLTELRSVLENPKASLSQIRSVVLPRASYDRGMLEGTQYDHEEWYRNGCTADSWPAVQVRRVGVEEGGEVRWQEPAIRWAHEPNSEINGKLKYGNASFMGGAYLSAAHVNEAFHCEQVDQEIDVAACSINDLTVNKEAMENIQRMMLDHDRLNSHNDLHGQLVHILSIHEKRGAAENDNADITSTRLIKLTKNLIQKYNLPLTIEVKTGTGENDTKTVSLERSYEASYIGFIPSRDVNDDNKKDVFDTQGMSGSPVITDEHSAQGRALQSGLVWGATELDGLTAVYVFGPDVLTDTLDKVNTIVSQDLGEDEIPPEAKRIITAKVQEALREYGYTGIAIDGLFGDNTRQVIEDYQRREFTFEELRSKVLFGTIDRLTWDKLLPQFAHINKNDLYESLR